MPASASPVLDSWLARAAAERGNARALVHRDTYLSWTGLHHRVERRARELGSLGIQTGDRVGLMLGNVPELAVLGLACARLGACPVLLDPTTSPVDLHRIQRLTGLRALITRPVSEAVRPGTSAGRPMRRPQRRSTVALRVDDPVPAHAAGPSAVARARLPGTLLPVSLFPRPDSLALENPGAARSAHVTVDMTGEPRVVLRDDAQLCAIADTLRRGLSLDATSTLVTAVPLHHALGFDFGLVAALAAGATLHLLERLTGRDLAWAFALPAGAHLLAPAETLREFGRSPLREPRALRGAARISCPFGAGVERSVRAFQARCGHAPSVLYHEPESGPVAWDEEGRHPHTCGRPLPGVKLQVRALDGTALPVGVAGRLWLRSPAASDRCLPRLALPVRAAGRAGVPIGRRDADGWMRTGALASRDQDGRLLVSGREDDVVEVDGRRIALGEVAACLESLPEVRAAEARVEWDELSGPTLVARLVVKGGRAAEPAALAAHCARNLAPHMVPGRFTLCAALD